MKGDFPLSFLNPRFTSLSEWTPLARGKVLDLLHYTPPPCSPAAETVERVDCGDYVREKVWFNTTPDVRVPAYVLVPKNAPKPAPAIVALHDHGGFYLWGKEKLVAIDGEHAVFTEFRARYYGGRSIAIDLVRRGYVVVVTDMFYWGERRMLLDDDPADWRERPSTMTAERIQAFNTRASQNEQLVGRTIYSAGFTWPGVMFWDDVRTVDYLLTRPDVDPKRIGCVGLSVGAVRSAHLAALDERIKAGVVVCWMTSFPAQLKKHVRNTIGHTKVVPGLHRHLDYPDVASLAMPQARAVHERHEGRPVRSRRREGEFREAERLLRQGWRPGTLPHAVVRQSAPVQRGDAGRGVGLAGTLRVNEQRATARAWSPAAVGRA